MVRELFFCIGRLPLVFRFRFLQSRNGSQSGWLAGWLVLLTVVVVVVYTIRDM